MQLKTEQGFTLIELMVVLVIMASIMGLVGGLTIDQFERTEARSEELTLKNQIQHIANRAFITGRIHNVSVEGGLLEVRTGETVISSRTFDHLFFQPQTFNVYVTGQTSLNELKYQLNSNNKSLNLDSGVSHAEQSNS